MTAQRNQLQENTTQIASGFTSLRSDFIRAKSRSAKTASKGKLAESDTRELHYPWHNLALKRVIDLALGLPLLILSIPILAVLVIFIKIVSPGPAFYRQTRIGYRGRKFQVLKLRTMHIDAERRLQEYLESNEEAKKEWQTHFKIKKDPRIIPLVGSFIRRCSLDEIPQLVNVMRCEMSLVGPRPLPEYHLDEYDKQFQRLRETVMPGLTGLWQVSSRADGDLDDLKLSDTLYIRRWSIRLDLQLLLSTIWAVLAGRGAY